VSAVSARPRPPRPGRPPRRQAGPAGRGGRGARLLRARPGDPARARPALLGLLLATAVLYLAGLSRNGYANEFYAAAVQAGTKSWKAFLFGSVDSGNFITVDKTPASLWVMELSGRVFGFNYWSLLVPQALEGVAAVGVLYTTVRRWFGPPAAIIAGTVLAVTPVATLMFRFDNPDALLVLVMTLAAYTVTRAVESGRTRWIAATGALLGLGYLTKMLQAFLVLPAFGLVYLWGGPGTRGRRLGQLLAGTAALVASAGWWVAIDLLTPAADRPYVGGSTDNNILQLTFGYNGLGRLTGSENSPGGGGGGGGGGLFGGATGITRLLRCDMAGRSPGCSRPPWSPWPSYCGCPGGPRGPTGPAPPRCCWGGWLVVTGAVFSYMSGIIHPYYTVALAQRIRGRGGRPGRRFGVRGPDHRVGQGAFHREDRRRDDRLRPHPGGEPLGVRRPRIREAGQVSRIITSAEDRWSTISPVATNVRVTKAELYTQRIFMGVWPVLRKACSAPATM
jgi:4-amino-4-deoxy-L-arabinose transferase-like glycosyltransferase